MPNKRRVQVQPLPGPVQVTPRAAPVDTFHRSSVAPAPEGDSQMLQLAKSLSSLQPALGAFGQALEAEKLQKLSDENDQGAATAEQRQLTVKGLKAAIDRGDIPAAASPAFIHGMRQQAYRIEAMNYDSALRASYAQSSAKNDDEIGSFITGFNNGSGEHEGYLAQTGIDFKDPDAARIMGEGMQRSQANLMAIHRQDRDHQIEQQAVNNTYRETQGILDGAMVYASPEAVASTIKSRVDGMVANGLNGQLANRAVVDAISDYALEHKDRSILTHLDRIDTGNGTLGSIQYAKDKRLQVEDHLDTESRSTDSHHWALEAHLQKKAAEKSYMDFQKATFDAPKKVRSDLLSDASRVDPDLPGKLLSFQNSYQNALTVQHTDEKLLAQTYEDIENGTFDHESLTKMASAGNVAGKDIQDFHIAIVGREAHDKLRSNQILSDYEKDLKTHFVGSDFFNIDSKKNAKYLAAKHEYWADLEEFSDGKDGKKPSRAEIRQHAKEIFSELTGDTGKSAKPKAGEPGEAGVTSGEQDSGVVDYKTTTMIPSAGMLDLLKQDYNNNLDKDGGQLGIFLKANNIPLEKAGEFLQSQRALLNKAAK